jgi:hypothetical protein
MVAEILASACSLQRKRQTPVRGTGRTLLLTLLLRRLAPTPTAAFRRDTNEVGVSKGGQRLGYKRSQYLFPVGYIICTHSRSNHRAICTGFRGRHSCTHMHALLWRLPGYHTIKMVFRLPLLKTYTEERTIREILAFIEVRDLIHCHCIIIMQFRGENLPAKIIRSCR